MNVNIRISQKLYDDALTDLRRPHPFACERIGFFSSSTVQLDTNDFLIFLKDFHSIQNEHYIDNPEVGACIGREAIQAAMQRSLKLNMGQIHAHIHEHAGRPHPSPDDLEGVPPITRSLSLTSPDQTSGYLILSRNSAWAELHIAGTGQIAEASKITVTGFPLQFLR